MADTDPRPNTPAGVSRRDILKMGGALAGAGAAVTALGTPLTALANSARSELNEATVVQLQGMMASGRLSSAELVDYYLARIASLDQSGPRVNAVLELNPDARAIARALDRERHHSGARGPLHGIPVLLKDNIDTHDRMQTAAGSLALVGTPALQDSTVAARLRRAGAVILGKTNLSEWANFRSTFSSSGWSGRGGQCNNPYILDRNPCGSSSGSGAAASANFTAVSIGTETDGSIVCPAHMNGVVGIKPTVGLTSRAGVVPISHTQDTVGPHARTVADAAALLGALVGVDPRDPATAASAGKFFSDYTQFLDPNALRTARLGVLRDFVGVGSPHSDTVFEKAVTALASAGATLVDITGFPGLAQINSGAAETTVLFNEFKHDLNAYLATRTGVPIHSLAEGIAFNIAHAAQEMPYFAQEIWDLAEATSGDLGNPDYLAALATDRQLGVQGIDAVLAANNLDALVGPTASPAWPTDLVNGDRFIFGTSSIAAIVGYPIVVVPMGFAFGLPLGISFFGTAFSEPTLIKLAYAFEQATHFRQQPQFLPTLNAG
ncbi:MAG TPA: amidase, partial [Candidatus Limnocylindrales bacterium]|nr:amidase [Candidatus Limnocylindrales bacterium]